MGWKDKEHTKQNIVWSGKDYKSRSVKLYVPERNHILEHHGIMGMNFTAIYDTVEDPATVYTSGEGDDREVFFKRSAYATYSAKLLTKTIVQYNEEKTEGYIVTAMPSGKEGGNVDRRIYPEEDI